MADLFLKVLNMSISAGWLVLAVIAARFVLRKAPRWLHVLLWAIVAVRLICPITLESIVSLVPSSQVVRPSIMMDATPQIHSGIPFINDAVNPILSESFAPDPTSSANPLQILIPVLAIMWLIGVAAMLLYSGISYIRLSRKLREAVLLQERIYQTDRTASPFILGLFKPRIYLPYGLDEENRNHVIAHEQSHISRKDHLWKPLGYILLSLHWFNPLVWMAYIFLCRDIELACDERVIRKMGVQQRADYSQALLNCSISRKKIIACPLAFGEVCVKQRIRSVLNYKKPGFWLVLVAIILCAVLAVCFLTDPVRDNSDLSGKKLAVCYKDDDIAKWIYYDIELDTRHEVPGACPIIFSIHSVSEDGIVVNLHSSELRDNDNVTRQFPVSAQVSETFYKNSNIASTWYKFTLVNDSDISSAGAALMGSYMDLKQVPDDYSLQQAEKDGCVVMENGDVAAGKDLWWNFYSSTLGKIPSGIRVVSYYSNEFSVGSSGMYVQDLTFDGEFFILRWYENEKLTVREYRNLLRFQGPAEDSAVAYESYERYVLTDDPNVTWKELRNDLLSSSSVADKDFYLIYTNLVYSDQPSYAELNAAQANIMNVMGKYRIASVKINQLSWRLEIEVYDHVEGLKELVEQYLDEEYYEIGDYQGDLFYLSGRTELLTLADILAFAKSGKMITHKDLLPYQYDYSLRGDSATRFLTVEGFDLLVMYQNREPKELYLAAIDGTYVDIYKDDLNAFILSKDVNSPAYRITGLLNIVSSFPLTSSDINDYIESNREAYDSLLGYGEELLKFSFTKFRQSAQYDRKGKIMALACQDIMASWGETYEIRTADSYPIWSDAQQWFDEFEKQAKALAAKYDEEVLKRDYPGAWLLLNMES